MGEAKVKALEIAAVKTIIGARSCRSCEFRVKMHEKLFCRRYPPQNVGGLAPGPEGRPITLFISSYPEANPEIPCGEYKRNEMNANDELMEAAPAGIILPS